MAAVISKSAKCIYCSAVFDPRAGEGEHSLPFRLTGEFEHDVTFRGICCECNNGFSPLDQMLMQESPLGHYRSIVKPNLGKRANRGSLLQKAPVSKVFGEDCTLLVNRSFENPNDVIAIDQLIIKDRQGQEHHVRLFPQMSKEAIQKKLPNQTILDDSEIRLDCDEKNNGTYAELLADIFPQMKLALASTIDAGSHPVHGRITFNLDDRYFRGIAKIAFHYYLSHTNRNVRGDEPEFQAIRDFIRDGGNWRTFFTASGKALPSPFGTMANGEAVRARNWGHYIVCDESDGLVVICLQLFVGPESPSNQHMVTLAHPPSSATLEVGGTVWGHIYQYETDRDDDYTGTAHRFSSMPELASTMKKTGL